MRQAPAATAERALARVAAIRTRLANDPALAARVRRLRQHQASRLQQTYADLRRQPRYRAAVEFFQSDLYGTKDPLARDRQLAAALGKLRRWLPDPALEVLGDALELHALTLELDLATAQRLDSASFGDADYLRAYRAAAPEAERRQQIGLVIRIGRDLEGLASSPLISMLLRLAHRPAHAAGYGQLQDFIERGHAAFRAMGGAEEFLAMIEARETAELRRLQGAGV